MLLDGVRRVDRDLIVGRVAVLDRKVVILEVDIKVGVDQLVLDILPDDRVISSPSSSTTDLRP